MKKRNSKKMLGAAKAQLQGYRERLKKFKPDTLPYTSIEVKIKALEEEVAKLKTQI